MYVTNIKVSFRLGDDNFMLELNEADLNLDETIYRRQVEDVNISLKSHMARVYKNEKYVGSYGFDVEQIARMLAEND